jgi:hypothetical protein
MTNETLTKDKSIYPLRLGFNELKFEVHQLDMKASVFKFRFVLCLLCRWAKVVKQTTSNTQTQSTPESLAYG